MLEKILKPKKALLVAALLLGLSGGFNKIQAGGLGAENFHYGRYFGEKKNNVTNSMWIRDFLKNPSDKEVYKSWFNGYDVSGIEPELKDVKGSFESFAKGINEPKNFMKFLIAGADTEEKALFIATIGGGYFHSVYNDIDKLVTSREEEAKIIRDKIYSKENDKGINCINSANFQADIVNESHRKNGVDLRAGVAMVFGDDDYHLIVPVRNLKSGEFFLLNFDKFQRAGTWDLSEAIALYSKNRKERVILSLAPFEINGYYSSKTKTQEEYEKTISPLGVLTEDFGGASLKNLLEKKFDNKNKINFYLNSFGYGVKGDFFFEKKPIFVDAKYGFSGVDANQPSTFDELSNATFPIFNFNFAFNNSSNENAKPDFNIGGFSLYAEKKESTIPEYGDYETDFSSSKVGLKNEYGKIEIFKIYAEDKRISMFQSFEGASFYFGKTFSLFSDRFSLGLAKQISYVQKSERDSFYGIHHNLALDFIAKLKNGFYSTIGIDTDNIVKDIFNQQSIPSRIANTRFSAGIQNNLYRFGVEGKLHYADDSMGEILYEEFKINFEKRLKNFNFRGEFLDKSFKNGWDELYVDKKSLSLGTEINIGTNLMVNGEYSINEDTWRDFSKSQSNWKIGLEKYF